ncbi:MAG: GreA/GreB family elongation factor [Candidatus Villigracilaceae bacterium]
MNPANLRVEIGTHVELELIGQSGERECLNLTLVPDEQADFQSGFLGAGTPLTQAILGRRAGEVLPYIIGDLRQVHILTVQTATPKKQTVVPPLAANPPSVKPFNTLITSMP